MKLNKNGNLLFSSLSIIIILTSSISILVGIISAGVKNAAYINEVTQAESEAKVKLVYVTDYLKSVVNIDGVSLDEVSIEKHLQSTFDDESISVIKNEDEIINDKPVTNFDITYDISENEEYYQTIYIEKDEIIDFECDGILLNIYDDWDSKETYTSGYLVRYSGNTYVSIDSTSNDQPDERKSKYWINLGSSNCYTDYYEFSQFEIYSQGDIVTYLDSFYIMYENLNVSNVRPGNDDRWIKLRNSNSSDVDIDGDGVVKPNNVSLGIPWAGGLKVYAYDVVKYNNKSYVAMYDIPSSQSWNNPISASYYYKEILHPVLEDDGSYNKNGTRVSGSDIFNINDIRYNDSNYYVKYDPIFIDGKLQICTTVSRGSCNQYSEILDVVYQDAIYVMDDENIDEYVHGKKYSIGDIITYNGYYYFVKNNINWTTSTPDNASEYSQIMKTSDTLSNIEYVEGNKSYGSNTMFTYRYEVYYVLYSSWIQADLSNISSSNNIYTLPTKLFFNEDEANDEIGNGGSEDDDQDQSMYIEYLNEAPTWYSGYYSKGYVTQYNDIMYIKGTSDTANNRTSPADSNEFFKIGYPDDKYEISNWESSINYNDNQVVLYDDKFYVSLCDISSKNQNNVPGNNSAWCFASFSPNYFIVPWVEIRGLYRDLKPTLVENEIPVLPPEGSGETIISITEIQKRKKK